MKRMLIAALTANLSVAASAQEIADWPYPEDTPTVSEVAVGIAGEKPADITRFLLARGGRAPLLNADASMMAFADNVTGDLQLWVMDLERGQPRQITFGNGITNYDWHPDGDKLIYAADNNGDEREAYYLISADGKSEREVLGYADAFRQLGEFDEDGKSFLYSSTERNGLDFDVYEASLETGESKMLLEASFNYFPAAKQPNGDLLIITDVRGEDGHDVYMLNTSTGSLDVLFQPDVSAEFTGFEWAPDGRSFFYLTNDGSEYLRVAQYDLASGDSTTIAEGDLDHEQLGLSHDGRYLSFQTNEGGYSKLHVLDFETGNYVDVPELPVGVMRHNWSGGTNAMALQVSGPGMVSDLFTWTVGDESAVHAYASNLAGLDATDMKVPEPISFTARDGVTAYGLLYLPEGVEKPPVVVDVHGGPTAQARPGWSPITQYLVGKGIAVLDINVRGSTGYGKTFARLDNQEKRLDSVRDLVDALDWMREDGRVDADRAAVMGGSYGGYMVNAVMGSYPGAFKAGASFVGVSNWVRALETASPGLKASDRVEYGDIREERWQKFYAENSPINNADKIKAPMFFEHGVNDPRDPVTETDVIVKAIRDNGFEVEYLRFPDEGHSVSKMKNRITFYRRLAAFLEKHLGAE